MTTTWPIRGCVTADTLARRAEDGDPDAIAELALITRGRDLSSTQLRLIRDHRIRALAAELHAAMPGIRPHRVASLLVDAGFRLERGRALDGSTFAIFGLEEVADLADRIRQILALAPSRRDGAKWPGARRMRSIVTVTISAIQSR